MAAGRFGVVVENRGGDGDHARAVRQAPAELHAVLVTQALDVRGDEVRALRLVDLEADLAQPGARSRARGDGCAVYFQVPIHARTTMFGYTGSPRLPL